MIIIEQLEINMKNKCMYWFYSYISVSNCISVRESWKVFRYIVNKSHIFSCIVVLLIQKTKVFLKVRLEQVVNMRYKNISIPYIFKLLKPTGHVMDQQFNMQQLYVLPTLYLCVLYLSESKNDLCHLQYKLIGFYNRDEKCLLRGATWVFK